MRSDTMVPTGVFIMMAIAFSVAGWLTVEHNSSLKPSEPQRFRNAVATAVMHSAHLKVPVIAVSNVLITRRPSMIFYPDKARRDVNEPALLFSAINGTYITKETLPPLDAQPKAAFIVRPLKVDGMIQHNAAALCYTLSDHTTTCLAGHKLRSDRITPLNAFLIDLPGPEPLHYTYQAGLGQAAMQH